MQDEESYNTSVYGSLKRSLSESLSFTLSLQEGEDVAYLDGSLYVSDKRTVSKFRCRFGHESDTNLNDTTTGASTSDDLINSGEFRLIGLSRVHCIDRFKKPRKFSRKFKRLMGRSAKITRTVGFMKQKKIQKGKEWKKSGSQAIRQEKKEAKREIHLPKRDASSDDE
jgi:hypothetical protein